MTSLLRPIIFMFAGFCTWYLALVRTVFLIRQQKTLLCILVFCDELVTICLGVWLARHGTFVEIISLALGGAVAASIVVRKMGDKTIGKI